MENSSDQLIRHDGNSRTRTRIAQMRNSLGATFIRSYGTAVTWDALMARADGAYLENVGNELNRFLFKWCQIIISCARNVRLNKTSKRLRTFIRCDLLLLTQYNVDHLKNMF